jgi:hypothetical protein
MRDTAGAATENQRVVVELTNIAYYDIMRPMELLETADAGLVGDDTLDGCSALTKQRITATKSRCFSEHRPRISAEDEM